jgi:hypothetical protein
MSGMDDFQLYACDLSENGGFVGPFLMFEKKVKAMKSGEVLMQTVLCYHHFFTHYPIFTLYKFASINPFLLASLPQKKTLHRACIMDRGSQIIMRISPNLQ